jgi:hypothetical protein
VSLLFAFALLAGIVYFSAKIVLKIRDNPDAGTIKSSKELVIGFKDIPTYPQAEYIFKNMVDQEEVQKFINSGYSVYRLPPGDKIYEVYDYYNEILPSKGWELTEQVDIGTEDKRYGQYWIKDNEGLRIYSRTNDIWYQKISRVEAKEALASDVSKEIERELILAASNKTEFLPDFPWELELPGEYIAAYSAAKLNYEKLDEEFEDLQEVKIKRIGSKEYILLKPRYIYEGGVLDGYLDKAAEELNLEILNAEKGNGTNFNYLIASTTAEIELIGDEDPLSIQDNETNNDNNENLEDGEEANQSNNENQNTDKDEPELSQVIVMLNGEIKVVYTLEIYGSSENTEILKEYVLKNIKVSKPEL